MCAISKGNAVDRPTLRGELMKEFWDSFVSGLKEGPRLFFAPVWAIARTVSQLYQSNR